MRKKPRIRSGGINEDRPKILVVAPPLIDEKYNETNARRSMGRFCDQKSQELPGYLKEFLIESDFEFLNTSETVSMNTIDFIHLDEKGHRRMADLITLKVKELL